VISNGKSTFLRVYNLDGDPFTKTSHIAVRILFIIELSKIARLNRVSFMFIDSYTTNCLLLAHVSRNVTIKCKSISSILCGNVWLAAQVTVERASYSNYE
jgi:hypothetical protein